MPSEERVVHEAEAVERRELFQVRDVRAQRSAIALVLKEHDQVQMIETPTLPLCNTG
jgi:hypothetical protein